MLSLGWQGRCTRESQSPCSSARAAAVPAATVGARAIAHARPGRRSILRTPRASRRSTSAKICEDKVCCTAQLWRAAPLRDVLALRTPPKVDQQTRMGTCTLLQVGHVTSQSWLLPAYAAYFRASPFSWLCGVGGERNIEAFVSSLRCSPLSCVVWS